MRLKKIFILFLSIFTISFLSFNTVLASSNVALLHNHNSTVIEPAANKRVHFNFDNVYFNSEIPSVDVQLYGYIDDVSGRLINVAGVQWYNNPNIGYYNKDKLTISETHRVDNYTIKVKLKYTYQDIFGKNLSEYYRSVTCDSPGPSGWKLN